MAPERVSGKAVPTLRLIVTALAACVLGALPCAAPAAGSSASLSVSSRANLPAPDSTVRRVCLQMGVQAYQAPNKSARILNGIAGLPERLGGGQYVQVTGLRTNGYLQVRTLKGQVLWVPERDPQSGTSSLCDAFGTTMRVCRRDSAPPEVPIQEDFDADATPPVTFVQRGSLVRLWGYFEQRGRWTFMETRGTVGFIRSEELCHEGSMPPGTQATERFRMSAAPAKPDCYQWRRERAAREIRRIVIHNSEKTIEDTIATFQECDPERPTSAHVGIDRDGTIYRFVEDKFAAFHTGGSPRSGGFNSASLGIELIAYDRPGFTSMTPQQERSLLDLIRFWAKAYHITIPRKILQNSTRSKGYNDVEYWHAPVTLHRLVSADRATDCPKFIWADTPQGDEEFFTWRRKYLGSSHSPR